MKATGIVRRIDDLGRVVIPKEIRRTLRIRESDPPEIKEVFTQLGNFLETLPIDDNNNLFSLICQLCIAFDQKAYIDGLQTGAHLINELYK